MPIWGYRYQPFPIGTDQTTNRNLPDPEPMIRGRILSLIDYLNRSPRKSWLGRIVLLKSAVGPLADIVVATCDVCFFPLMTQSRHAYPEDRQCTRRKRPVVLFLVFPLPQEQKSDLRLFFRQRNVSRAVSMRLYISNVIQVYIYFFIFNIS